MEFSQRQAVEDATRDQLVAAFRELLETRGLYQNITVPTYYLEQFADDEYAIQDLLVEFGERPLYPRSHSDESHGPPFGFPGVAVTRTPHNRLPLSFNLPNVNSACTKCRKETTFQSMLCSDQGHSEGPYPIFGADTEQVFQLIYRCGSCLESYLVFQVLRRGFKLQLTGRSIPFRQKLAPEWPKVIRTIVQDANSAASENDLSGAYYHLRTAIEFFIKHELGLDMTQRKDGSELCEEYNSITDDRLKQGLPSLGSLYSILSNGLHSRQVSKEEYDQSFSDFLNHLRAKALFSEYAQQRPSDSPEQINEPE